MWTRNTEAAMKVFATKYVLTKGILELEVEESHTGRYLKRML